MREVEYIIEQPTDEQRQRARASALYQKGDMKLVWISEGDLPFLRAALAAMPGEDAVWNEAIEAAAGNTETRSECERLMRDRARKEDMELANAHGDRASALTEAASAIRHLRRPA